MNSNTEKQNNHRLVYESEGTVSKPINAKLASLVDKMVITSLSEEKDKIIT